ncbi:unnamed protein product [Sphagnum jensenii]|uniref:Clu domain-containing protein n=1 Tax=Sphagnum jensenii TaxID=128206 RepID=A0ABP0X6P0_9BRYO
MEEGNMERGNMKFSVWREIADASKKTDVKSHASHQEVLKLSNDDRHALAKKNLLKGITADENTCIHDTATLGTVIVRHQGYTVLVEAAGPKPEEGEELPTDLAINEQIDGGANALNVNSLRTLLHTSSSGANPPPPPAQHSLDEDDL